MRNFALLSLLLISVMPRGLIAEEVTVACVSVCTEVVPLLDLEQTSKDELPLAHESSSKSDELPISDSLPNPPQMVEPSAIVQVIAPLSQDVSLEQAEHEARRRARRERRRQRRKKILKAIVSVGFELVKAIFSEKAREAVGRMFTQDLPVLADKLVSNIKSPEGSLCVAAPYQEVLAKAIYLHRQYLGKAPLSGVLAQFDRLQSDIERAEFVRGIFASGEASLRLHEVFMAMASLLSPQSRDAIVKLYVDSLVASKEVSFS